MKILNRLQRFRNLSSNNKDYTKQYYTPRVTPPNLFTKHYFTCIIQKTTAGPKQSPKIYRNTRLTDRIPSTTLHTRNELPAISTYIHRRAIDAWTQLHDKKPNLYDTVKPEADELIRHTTFTASFLTAEVPEPPRPIYV